MPPDNRVPPDMRVPPAVLGLLLLLTVALAVAFLVTAAVVQTP